MTSATITDAVRYEYECSRFKNFQGGFFMFSYYGSKSKIVDYYPPPKFDKIIEPFAGSAKYALKYWQKDVLLMDKYEIIYKIWKWLQLCSKADILKLPILKQGDKLNDIVFDCEEAKLFMGFLAAGGVAIPQFTAVYRTTTHRPNWIKYSLKRISNDIDKIKHWEIKLGSYEDLQNETATWFIDPPYQFGGQWYKHKTIDYKELHNYCKSRNGQVIVCENTKADWIELQPLVKIQGATNSNTTEAIWTNIKSNEQKTLQF